MNTWKRIPAIEAGTTHYVSTTGYQVFGRNVNIAAARGGGRTIRRFTACGPDNKPLPTGEFDTLKKAKAYADEQAANAAAPANPTPGRTTVTHADGTTSTRKSKTMTYTHAVEIAPAPATAYAASLIRKAEEREAHAAKLRQAITYNEVRIGSRGFGTVNDMVSHKATLTGTDIYTWCNREGKTEDHRNNREIIGVRAHLLRSAADQAEIADQQAAKYRAEAAAILAKGEPVGSYGILRWSSRADLAVKALNEFDHCTSAGHPLRVVTVDAN